LIPYHCVNVVSYLSPIHISCKVVDQHLALVDILFPRECFSSWLPKRNMFLFPLPFCYMSTFLLYTSLAILCLVPWEHPLSCCAYFLQVHRWMHSLQQEQWPTLQILYEIVAMDIQKILVSIVKKIVLECKLYACDLSLYGHDLFLSWWGWCGAIGSWGTRTHQCTINWMPVITQLWMNLNWVNIWFHLGNQFCKK